MQEHKDTTPRSGRNKVLEVARNHRESTAALSIHPRCAWARSLRGTMQGSSAQERIRDHCGAQPLRASGAPTAS